MSECQPDREAGVPDKGFSCHLSGHRQTPWPMNKDMHVNPRRRILNFITENSSYVGIQIQVKTVPVASDVSTSAGDGNGCRGFNTDLKGNAAGRHEVRLPGLKFLPAACVPKYHQMYISSIPSRLLMPSSADHIRGKRTGEADSFQNLPDVILFNGQSRFPVIGSQKLHNTVCG